MVWTCALFFLHLFAPFCFILGLKRIDARCYGFADKNLNKDKYNTMRAVHKAHKLYDVRLLLHNFFIEPRKLYCCFSYCICYVIFSPPFPSLCMQFFLRFIPFIRVIFYSLKPKLETMSSAPCAYVFNLQTLFCLLW